MAFPERLLTDGEEVVVEMRPHWSFLGWPLIASLGAASVVIGAVVIFPHTPVGVSYALLGVLVLSGLVARRSLHALSDDEHWCSPRFASSGGRA